MLNAPGERARSGCGTGLKCLGALVATVVLITACGSEQGPEPEITKFSVAAYEGELNGLIYLARERGLYEAQGLDVEIKSFSSGKEAVASMMNGDAALATASVSVFIRQYLAGERNLNIVTSVAGYDVNHLLARVDHGIERADDLRGKRVAVFRGTSSEYLLQITLTDHGLSRQDVTLLDMKPAEARRALAAGTVDAAMIWDPHAFKLRQEMGERLTTLKPMLRSRESFLLMARRQWISQHPATLERLLRALSAAQSYSENNPDETREFLARRFDLSEEYVDYITPAIDMHLALPQSLVLSIEKQMQWFREQHGEGSGEIPDFLDAIHVKTLDKMNPSDVNIYK